MVSGAKVMTYAPIEGPECGTLLTSKSKPAKSGSDAARTRIYPPALAGPGGNLTARITPKANTNK